MTKQEAVILYQSQTSKKGLRLLKLLLPIWGLIPFCILLLLVRQLVSQASAGHANVALAIVVVMIFTMALIGVGLMLVVALSDDRIVMNELGMNFPPAFMPALQCRCERAWSDLSAVDINTERTAMLLTFKSGGMASIDIDEMNEEDADKLITFLDIWHSQVSVRNFSANQLARLSTIDDLFNFTDLWEKEMNRRFHATSYAPLEPGCELQQGALRILRQLGCGGFSAIYLAQRNLDELVVLKEAVLPAYTTDDARDKAKEFFAREAAVLIKTNHRGIAGVFDYFIEEDRHYLLLEYIRGEDLRQMILRAGRQTEASTVAWAFKMAESLQYLHSLEPAVIHRDLTPENLVLTKSGDITLIDFGAANFFVGTATGTIVGKQGYIAPEQFKGKATLKSDIFSFGCTLYFILTGLDPQPLSTSRVLDERSDISDELCALIERCTDLDAQTRPTAAELVAILGKISHRRSRVLSYR